MVHLDGAAHVIILNAEPLDRDNIIWNLELEALAGRASESFFDNDDSCLEVGFA